MWLGQPNQELLVIGLVGWNRSGGFESDQFSLSCRKDEGKKDFKVGGSGIEILDVEFHVCSWLLECGNSCWILDVKIHGC